MKAHNWPCYMDTLFFPQCFLTVSRDLQTVECSHISSNAQEIPRITLPKVHMFSTDLHTLALFNLPMGYLDAHGAVFVNVCDKPWDLNVVTQAT